MQSLGDTSRAWSRRASFRHQNEVVCSTTSSGEGINAIPYKGPTLAVLAYGNFALRHFEDLDFVLPQEQVTRALHVLEAAGFQSSLDPTVARDARLIAEGQLGQYCFFSAKSNTLVELHSEKTLRYFPAPLEWQDLRHGLLPVSIGDREVHTFSIENTNFSLIRGTYLCQSCGKCRGLNPCNVKVQLAGGDEIEPGVLQRLSFRLRSHETWSQGIHQCFSEP